MGMTFDQIWNQLLKKSSDLADPQAKVEFSSENLKALLRQVYEQAEKTGAEKSKQDSSPNMFDRMFGGGL